MVARRERSKIEEYGRTDKERTRSEKWQGVRLLKTFLK